VEKPRATSTRGRSRQLGGEMSGSFGPMKLDFSSFYKFVASVGLVLIASSVAVPWFVLRAAAPEAPQDSPAAAIVELALDERADQYQFIVQAYPWVSLGLFLGGCGLTAYGLIAWRGRQKKQDADEDEAYRQRRELGKTTQASEVDREQKLDREALSEEDPSVEENGQESTVRVERPVSVPPRVTEGSVYDERRNFIKEAEAKVGRELKEAFADTHEVEAGVRIGSDAAILDLVARANDPARWSSFAVEIRVISSSIPATVRLRESMLSVAIAARDVPEGQLQLERVGRPPVAKSVSILLVVVREGEPARPGLTMNFPDFVRRLDRTVKITNMVLSRKVGVILLNQSQIDAMSAEELRQSILEVMRRPESMAGGRR